MGRITILAALAATFLANCNAESNFTSRSSKRTSVQVTSDSGQAAVTLNRDITNEGALTRTGEQYYADVLDEILAIKDPKERARSLSALRYVRQRAVALDMGLVE